jgi:hypothetical protein
LEFTLMETEANPSGGADVAADPRASLANLLKAQATDSSNATSEMGEQEPNEGEQQDAQQGDQTEAAEPEFTVKVDGREFKVKQTELINGYQRDSDYRAKTMALAEERKAADAAKSQATERVKQLDDALTQVISRLEYEAREPADLVKLLDTNPQEYLKQKHAIDMKRAELAQARIAQNAMREQAANEHHEAMRKYVEAESARLLEVLPEWKDTAKATAEKDQLAKYLRGYGFSAEQLNSLTDHRDVLIARKAMLYDALMAQKPAVTKKVQAAPARAESAGAPQDGSDRSKNFQESMRRLSKTGSREDGRAAIKALLAR